ncbi:MAG: hypothetical protein IPO26_20990 [Saprospiraceae bacterium]|nr:hypothetical protein [Saprospiraceae bacterium]
MVIESIKILKSTISDTQTEHYLKKDVFKSLVEVMKNNQLILEEFVKAFIENDEFWLILIEGTEIKENFFESEFQSCIDKLEIDRVEKIANYWLDKVKSNSPVNITSEILIIEALHFGVIQHDQPLHARDYYRRKVNNNVKIVHEIIFPCNYSYVRDSYERMRYCDCSKDNTESKFKFGGKLFIANDSNINRIITLNPIPLSLNIKSLKSLTIGMDFDKAFWTPINTSLPYFIQHDSNGEPDFELNRIDTGDIEYYNPNPIIECDVVIRQTPEK